MIWTPDVPLPLFPSPELVGLLHSLCIPGKNRALRWLFRPSSAHLILLLDLPVVIIASRGRLRRQPPGIGAYSSKSLSRLLSSTPSFPDNLRHGSA